MTDSPSQKYPSDCELTGGLLARARERHEREARGYGWQSCLDRAAKVEMLLLDVDGVMTDGSLYFGADGRESKAFSSRDGLGIRLAQKGGVEVGIITARRSEAVAARAENLGISRLYQGVGKKIEVFRRILEETAIAPERIAYMGDDWLDLPVMREVGLAAAVADGAPEVREAAHFVSRHPGGHGAVRELCELLIVARGEYEGLLSQYAGD